MLRFSHRAPALAVVLVYACGAPAPPAAPSAPPVAPIAKEREPDVSPVPEPAGIFAVGRIAKPDALLTAVSGWTRIPIPVGPDLIKSVVEDDALADILDLGKPVDGAASVTVSTRHGIEPAVAFSVAVTAFDKARSKLGQSHKLVPAENGAYRVLGIAKGTSDVPAPPAGEQGSDYDDGGLPCMLLHAPAGARLVCGTPEGLDVLAPYLARTLSRETWPADVHFELRPEPFRGPLTGVLLAELTHSTFGSASRSVQELVEAATSEAADLVGDTQKLAFDMNAAATGPTIEMRLAFRSQNSGLSRLLTGGDPSRADAAPAAFWHLPEETDTAFFGTGSDPKLFDRPRELLANLFLEGAEASGMPDAERRAFRDVVADRLLSLFTSGPGIYAKGYDQAAVEKAVKRRQAVPDTDVPGLSEAKKALVEHAVGWHLVQVSQPVAKVAPVLKDLSNLWNRPAFTKWASSSALRAVGSPSATPQGKIDLGLPRMRIAPSPAGITLPRESVHLEMTIPRDDVDLEPPPAPGRRSAALSKPRKYHRSPMVVHVLAIPDGGATWIAIGMDGKMTAQKALASLSTAPEPHTLGSVRGDTEPLREAKLTAGGFVTVRGFAALTAAEDYDERAPFPLLAGLPGKGRTPLVFTARHEPPAGAARAGTSVSSFVIPRAFLEDTVKLVMSTH